MLTRITQEMQQLLSESASHASPAAEAQQDLEANEISCANQASLWSPMTLNIHVPAAVPGTTPPPPTPHSATLATQAPSQQAQMPPAALLAPPAALLSPPECPRASPVLSPPGRTWLWQDL